MANGVTILPSQRGFCAHTVVLGLSCSAAGTPPARPQRTVVADELVSHSRLDLLPVDGGRGAPQTAAGRRQLRLPTPAGTESAHFHCSEREQSASTAQRGRGLSPRPARESRGSIAPPEQSRSARGWSAATWRLPASTPRMGRYLRKSGRSAKAGSSASTAAQAAAGADQHVSCTPAEVVGPVVCRVRLRSCQKCRRGRVDALGSPLRRAQNLLPGGSNHVPARGVLERWPRPYHGRCWYQRPSRRRRGELPGSCWPPAPT